MTSLLNRLFLWLFGRPDPHPVPSPGIPRATFAVVVTDDQNRPLPQVTFRVNEELRVLTDENGYAALELNQGDVFFAVEAEKYHAVHSKLLLTQNTQLPVVLRRAVPVVQAPLVGRLRIEQQVFVDDTGPVLPLFAHAGDLFALWTRNRDRVRQQLDVVTVAGYHGLRVWTLLSGPYWERMHGGRTVNPGSTPNYWMEWRDFVSEVHERKLRLVVSQGDIGTLGSNMTERKAFAVKLAEIARAVDPSGHVYAFLDGGNEAWQTGEPDPQRLAQFVQAYKLAGGTALLTLTSPQSEEVQELDAYSIDPADCYDVHGSRDGRFWDKIRHIFSIPYEGKPKRKLGIQSEPNGGGTLVSVTTNKQELNHEAIAALAVQSLIARQAYVWFSGEGVSIDKGLETEPGFWQTPAACALLPKDVMSYATLHHSGDTWSALRLVDQGISHEVRVDGAQHRDGRCVYLFYGEPGTHRFRAARNFSGQLFDPAVGRSSAVPFRKVRGEQFELQWERARLFVGTVD